MALMVATGWVVLICFFNSKEITLRRSKYLTIVFRTSRNIAYVSITQPFVKFSENCPHPHGAFLKSVQCEYNFWQKPALGSDKYFAKNLITWHLSGLIRTWHLKIGFVKNSSETIVALRRPEGAAKGLNTETIKRFSDCALVRFEGIFSCAQFSAIRQFCDFWLKILSSRPKIQFKVGFVKQNFSIGPTV